jgi:sugar-specific transcriptional regulator TrmB
MDRISALRNVEEALAAFEAGDLDLAALERQVSGTLRTYATEFEGELSAYRATEPEEAAGLVVLARDEWEAGERVGDLLSESDLEVAVEPIEPGEGGTGVSDVPEGF